MNRIDELYLSNREPKAFAGVYAAYLCELLNELDTAAVAEVIELFCAARERGARIFFMGNGGSAATASHFANDIAIGTRAAGKPFKAVSLTDNSAVMTAIANDDGYENLFTRQLEVLLEPADVVVVISASGNSPNVVKALEMANQRGNPTVALTGFSGGRIAELANIVVHIRTDKGEYGPVEDLHMVLDHLIGSFLTRLVRDEQDHVAPSRETAAAK